MKPEGNVFESLVRITTVSEATEGRGHAVGRAHFLRFISWPRYATPTDPSLRKVPNHPHAISTAHSGAESPRSVGNRLSSKRDVRQGRDRRAHFLSCEPLHLEGDPPRSGR